MAAFLQMHKSGPTRVRLLIVEVLAVVLLNLWLLRSAFSNFVDLTRVAVAICEGRERIAAPALLHTHSSVHA